MELVIRENVNAYMEELRAWLAETADAINGATIIVAKKE